MRLDLHAVTAMHQEQVLARKIHVMAEALMYALQIPPGTTLVPFLAPMAARNNQEAIVVWLKEVLGFPVMAFSRFTVNELGPLLERRLLEIEECWA